MPALSSLLSRFIVALGLAGSAAAIDIGPGAHAQWGGWESLGGIILEEPDCTSWSANRIDCFARGTDRAMYHRWWDGAGWRGWESLGGIILEAPECVSWGRNRIDCFARGTDRAMYHRWWDGVAWRGWENLGGIILEKPECISWGVNRIDCFARGTDRAMYHRWWDGVAWRGWENLGGIILEQPNCVSWAVNRIDCFARGTDRAMYHRWWDGAAWRGWENLGGIILEQPECISWGVNRIDCFARGTDRAMYHRWWDGVAWRGWENLGGIILEQPDCVAWGVNRIDCFARGTDRAMYHRWWDGAAWRGWESLGGIILEEPNCVSWSANRLDCFARGTDRAMFHRWWPCPSCGLTVHNLQVGRFTTSAIANADVDRIFTGASTLLQNNDGPGDVACRIGFTRNGNVTVFSTGDGSIDSQAEFDAVLNAPGWVKVVNQINWCGSLAPNIIGCARVPGVSLAVVRFTSALEGILFAHEFGHNKGRSHRNDDANALMNGTIGSTRLRVNAAECTAFSAPSPALAATVAVMPTDEHVMPGGGMGDTEAASGDGADMPGGGIPQEVAQSDSVTMPGGGISEDAEAAGAAQGMPGGGMSDANAALASLPDIRDFVRQVFVHGVPFEEAIRYDASNVPILVEMLNDPAEMPHWANIAVTLAIIGGEEAVDPLIDFIENDTIETSPEAYTAKTSAIMALGYVLNATGSERVLAYLTTGLRPENWTKRNEAAMAPFQSGLDERNVDFAKFAILGLALSGTDEAADALESLLQPAPDAAPDMAVFQAQVSDLVSEALAENRAIAEEGLLDYYENR